ncbi:MAG: acyl-CoA reductase [Clostridia bacterium]|nr:acyl-CoA reductase [Clostridia bacterium]
MSRSDLGTLLCGGDWEKAQPLAPFAEEVLSFLSDLSALLMKTPAARPYPDVITFAFFCRRAHLEQLRSQYQDALDNRLGRGLSFHIAPSNVPINFAYSLVAALLAGNACVVKASSQDFPQTRIVCAAMKQLLGGDHQSLQDHMNVIIYPRERQDITEQLSAACDSRIIWGGDETVRRVRSAPLAPHANEVTFPDRYSLLAIRAEAVLQMDDKQLEKAAQGFYNDTYLTDQNACTSPRLLYWLGSGDPLQQAQDRFWNAVRSYAASRYSLEPVVAVDKLTAAYRAALQLPGSRIVPMADNLAVRIQLASLSGEIEENRCAGGFFLEYAAETLDDLIPVVKRKYQTLSYLGLNPDELRRFVRDNRLTGIDRIAPVGSTMDFSLTWDGIDLIRTLSRVIDAI